MHATDTHYVTYDIIIHHYHYALSSHHHYHRFIYLLNAGHFTGKICLLAVINSSDLHQSQESSVEEVAWTQRRIFKREAPFDTDVEPRTWAFISFLSHFLPFYGCPAKFSGMRSHDNLFFAPVNNKDCNFYKVTDCISRQRLHRQHG